MIRHIHEALSRLWSLFRRQRLDQDFADELSAHIDMLSQENQARGLSPEEARRQAMLRLGGVNAAKDLHRDARGLPRLEDVCQASWLDFKLGARMLIKSPALTLVGVMGMGIAIAVGAGLFAFFQATLFPTLPLDEGDRLVGIENWDTRRNNQDYQSLHDFLTWRTELRSIEEVGAFSPITRNLISEGSPTEQVRIVEITAVGLRAARVSPRLGRLLLEDDERKGAPDVIVIGYDEWRRRFASDPAVLGRRIRLGDAAHTVVGVMPEGFAFPINDRFWVPLRLEASDHARGAGPTLFVFGRLAPGFTRETAQAELTTLGLRTAAAFPATNERLRPTVVSYAAMTFDDVGAAEFVGIQFIGALLLIVICANVAILLYARTATRQGEIAVRHALGASRGRIVVQLFVEALVLASVAGMFGLGLLKLTILQVHSLLGGETGAMPFWISYDISSETLLVATAFTLLAAVIAGVVPALKATGRDVEFQLRQLGGGSGLQLGRTWTTLVVAQVAIAVAFLPAPVFSGWEATKYGISEPGFAADEFLTARLVLDRAGAPVALPGAPEREYVSRYDELQKELMRRLDEEAGVSAVTRGMGLPGEEASASIEVEGAPVGSGAGYQVRFLRVDLDFFETFGFTTLTGRLFESEDVSASAERVIVNRAFVDQVLGGANALGARVRYVRKERVESDPNGADLTRWYEIVGVVGNLPAQTMAPRDVEARLYHPLESGAVYPALALRLRGVRPAQFVPRLREIAASLDATLQLRRVMALDEVYRQEETGMRLVTGAFALVTLSVLLLSAAGLHALMSVTVARRRREIGIRTALGADRRQILWSIFARALVQLLTGVVIGVVVVIGLDRLTDGDLMGGQSSVVLPVVATLMLTAGLLAAIGPARRGLRISPIEALKEE